MSYDIGEGRYDYLTLSVEKIVVYHTENYSKMADGQKCRLYLGYNPLVDNHYPIGPLYGKVAMNTLEKNFYGDFKNNHNLVK